MILSKSQALSSPGLLSRGVFRGSISPRFFPLIEAERRGNRRDQIFLDEVGRQDFGKTQRQGSLGAEAGMRTTIKQPKLWGTPFPKRASTTVLFGKLASFGINASSLHGGDSLARRHGSNFFDHTEMQRPQLSLSLGRRHKAVF